MESRMIEALQMVLPLVKEMTGRDVQVSLCDREKAIATWPADSFSMPAAIPGLALEWDNPAQRDMLEVMKSGKQSVSFLPKEIMGVPIKGILTPIFEGGQVVGLVACAYSLERDIKVQESMQQLDSNLLQSKERVDEIAKEAVSLAEKIANIQGITGVVKGTTKEASGMVNVIQSNANKSNILALNASIEAARAGEAGKGFAVVASEMGKLAQVSGSSAKGISESLSGIMSAVEKVEEAVNEVNKVAALQAEGTEAITVALTEIAVFMKEVTDFVKQM